MAKKTYTLNMNGATSGEGSFSDCIYAFSYDTDASGFSTVLGSHTLYSGWTVSGTGPFTIEQPESAGNYLLTVSQGTLDATPTLTVTQEWTPSVNLSVDDNTISEPSGQSIIAFAIAAAHSASIDVAFTLGGTATVDDDYTASTSSPITIASGQSTATMSITVVDDAVVESPETVTVTLGSITGGEAGATNTITVTISSEDLESTPVMIVYAPTGLTLSVKVFERGSDTVVETVSLTEATNNKGRYEGDVTLAESGIHELSLFKDGTTHIGNFIIPLTTEPVEHYAQEVCGIEDPNGLISTVASSVWSAGTRTITGGTITTNSDKAGYGLEDGAITAAKIGSDAITAAKVASDVGIEIASAVRTNLTTELGRIDVASSTLATSAQAVALLATAAAILDDTGASGVVVASGSKSGYSLSETGLNAIPITDPGAIGNYTTWPTLLVGLFQLQISHKTVKSTSAQTITSYAADGSTPNFTMGFTSAAGIDTKGAAA